MKSAMLASQTIALGHGDVVVAGGFESMSNIPHYLQQSRKGLRLGSGTLVDGLLVDALTDVYNEQHMGMCAEVCADTHGFRYAIAQQFKCCESYATCVCEF